MNKSATIGKLSAALAKAQAELKNPHFDSVNPHFKSKFASLGAVRESVVPVFAKYGLAITQWPISTEGAAGCLTHLADVSGEWMEEPFLIPVDKHNAHGFASAVTYAKRIAMQSVAGVVGEQDDDANGAVGDNVQGQRRAGHITPASGMLESLDIDTQNYCRDVVHRVETLFKRGDVKGATDEWEMEAAKLLQISEFAKAGCWPLIDSKARSAIKAEQLRRKEKEMA